MFCVKEQGDWGAGSIHGEMGASRICRGIGEAGGVCEGLVGSGGVAVSTEGLEGTRGYF